MAKYMEFSNGGKMIVKLTQEEITMIGWGLLVLHADTRPEEKQETAKQAKDIMRKLNPDVTYDFGG